MKKIALALAAAGALAGIGAAPAAACDPGMPTCYGPERWLDDRLAALDEYVVGPVGDAVENLLP